MVVPS